LTKKDGILVKQRRLNEEDVEERMDWWIGGWMKKIEKEKRWGWLFAEGEKFALQRKRVRNRIDEKEPAQGVADGVLTLYRMVVKATGCAGGMDSRWFTRRIHYHGVGEN
jgi:hypothetical protein